mmetsp:Transcript_47708/g.144268  ORF Transcript_47708/g.144268 Transcript_47708/m.144268 type:complete len:138 (-) Transcript_47708:652-1065(-)
MSKALFNSSMYCSMCNENNLKSGKKWQKSRLGFHVHVLTGTSGGSEQAPTCTSIAAAATFDAGSEHSNTRNPFSRIIVSYFRLSSGGFRMLVVATQAAAFATAILDVPASVTADASSTLIDKGKERAVADVSMEKRS